MADLFGETLTRSHFNWSNATVCHDARRLFGRLRFALGANRSILL